MHEGRLDTGGRLSLPSVLQEYFAGFEDKKLFVTSLDRRIAAIYPISVWHANETILENHTEDPQAAERILFNATQLGQEVDMDGKGRVSFSSKLRQIAKLDATQLHFFGVKGHLEVLTDEIFAQKEIEAAAQATENVEKFKKVGLR